MALNASEAKKDYVQYASSASDKLVREFTQRTDKVARGASAEAQASYEAAMRDPVVLKRRQKNLAKITEEEMNAAMRAKGASAYSAGVTASADKWERKVQPYFAEIDRVLPTMKARGRDVTANVQNRVLPIALALRKLKEAQG